MHEQAFVPAVAWALPFVAMLLAIAVLPLAAPHFWESNLRKLGVAAALSAPVLALYLRERPHALVELELPEVARERAPRPVLAHVRRELLAARHAHDQLRVGAAGQRGVDGGREGAAEARVDVGDAEPELAVAERLHRARAAHAQRLDDVAAERDELGVVECRALDRLAAARLEHRARDRVEAAPVEVREQIDRELGPVHQPLHHDRLVDVAAEERGLLGVARGVDRARARATARLDHHRVGRRLLAGEHRRRGGQAEAREQQVGLVLVVRGARDLGVGDERRQAPVRARLGEDLDVEVRERDDGTDPVLRAQRLERRDVAGIVDPRDGRAHLRGVLRGRERVRVGRDHGRVLREGGHDVVALADAGEFDAGHSMSLTFDSTGREA